MALAARAILASEAVRQARRSGTLLRDVPLLARVEDVLLDETADVLYRTSEGTVVVVYAVNDSPENAAQRAGRIASALCAAAGHLPIAVDLVGSSGDTVRQPRVDQLACLAIAELQRQD